LYCKDC